MQMIAGAIVIFSGAFILAFATSTSGYGLIVILIGFVVLVLGILKDKSV